MKTKLLTLFVAFVATTALWASNTITYTATEKLAETTDSVTNGLHVNAFNVAISSHTFSNGVGTITFDGEVTTIGNSAFEGCSGLTSVTIPSSVTTIGSYAFYECIKLTSITIPNFVTTIGEGAFFLCAQLTSITIPNSVTTIGDDAFSDCRTLTSITIPKSVTSIGENTFSGCSKLTSVTIQSSVMSVGRNAFQYCRALTSITCYATNPPTCGSSCFESVDKSIPVYVPKQSIDAYKQAGEWKAFTNILPIGAEEVPATEPIITPDDHSVTITWPQTDNADTYTLEIRKNGELFCTITFNNQGVMIDITFAAPARNGVRTSSAAEMTSNGYKFTINGLEPGTEYTYAVIAKDASAQPLQTYSGSFETTMPTGLEDLTIDKRVGNKFIYGTNLYILRDGNLYTATGARVK
ncbi:MAG: leucine-rich repeat protein [Bacteroidales bacterium]|nr:leucine-rich repeat protein [Candidatus Colicola caccequi]